MRKLKEKNMNSVLGVKALRQQPTPMRIPPRKLTPRVPNLLLSPVPSGPEKFKHTFRVCSAHACMMALSGAKLNFALRTRVVVSSASDVLFDLVIRKAAVWQSCPH